jgi:hypothetical protein
MHNRITCRKDAAMITTPQPTIVCPPWCGITGQEHLEQLAQSSTDPDVHHKSAPAAWATVAQVLRADGVSSDDDQPPAIVGYAEGDLTLEEARDAARDYVAAAELLQNLLA